MSLERDIAMIQARHDGATHAQLATKFGVSRQRVSQIISKYASELAGRRPMADLETTIDLSAMSDRIEQLADEAGSQHLRSAAVNIRKAINDA